MTFPASIPVKDIKDTNLSYDYECIKDYCSLYLGGEEFRDRKERFLVPRKSDKKYPDQWKERLKRAFYINRAGGIIDFLAAAVLYDKPRYVVKDGASDKSRKYWEGLNKDADGLGHPIADVLNRSLVKSLVHNRSYLRASFDSDRGNLESGGVDANIDVVDPVSVTDWQHCEDGHLKWLKLSGIEAVRDPDRPWVAPDETRSTWSFYTDKEIAIYEAYTKNKQYPTDATLVDDVKTHGFGMPIFEIYDHPGMWVLDRIKDVVVAMFNRDSATTKYLDDGAFQLFVLKTEVGDTSNIVMKDMAGIKLETNGDAKWMSPESGWYNPLSSDQDYLKASLFEVMQSTAINAAAIPQAGRLSGEAVNQLREPLEVLLTALAWPQYDAWQRVTDSILKHRGEPEDTVSLAGLRGFNATLDDVKNVIDGGMKDGTRTTEDGTGGTEAGEKEEGSSSQEPGSKGG